MVLGPLVRRWYGPQRKTRVCYWYPTSLVQQWVDEQHSDQGADPGPGRDGDSAFHSSADTNTAYWPQLTVVWEAGLGDRHFWRYHEIDLAEAAGYASTWATATCRSTTRT